MAALAWRDRIKVASATTGTGTLTLGAAASGYQTFAAGDDGKIFDIVIEDGTAWETAHACVYTHSGTTLTRGVFDGSSTGSALSLSGSENVFVDLIASRQTANELAVQTYICGLVVSKHSGTDTLDISAGSCYDPSSSKIINYAGGTSIGIGSPVTGWNQVYIYDSSGTATIEVTNNANAPSTTYAGTARQGGTNSNRRWIGSFLTISTAMYVYDIKEVGNGVTETLYFAATGATPFRVLSAGTSTTYSAVSFVSAVPRYVCSECLCLLIATAASSTGGDSIIDTSVDGTNASTSLRTYVGTAPGLPYNALWVPIEAATPQVYYKMTAGSGVTTATGYIDVRGYRTAR